MSSDKTPDDQTRATYVDAITGEHEVSDSSEMLGTFHDQKDMYRMGKIQRLRVNQIQLKNAN
jgi:hypothetical protein